jgi:hypothetical protein
MHALLDKASRKFLQIREGFPEGSEPELIAFNGVIIALAR